MISPEECAERMKNLAQEKDLEAFHIKADDLMCETLKQLGYGEAVEIFESHEKWYS